MNSKSPNRKVLSEYVLNILSKPFTKVFLRTNYSPNFITFLGGLLALIGIILFPLNKLFSSLFILFYLILDLVDGDIARAKKIFTKLGKWGDSIVDKAVESLLIFAAFIEYKGNENIEYCLFITIAFVYITQFSMEIINSQKRIDSLVLESNDINIQKKIIKFNKLKVFSLLRYKKFLIFLLDNLSLGHSTLILMLTFGTLLLSENFIIPLLAMQSIYTLIYVLFCHYRICTKS